MAPVHIALDVASDTLFWTGLYAIVVADPTGRSKRRRGTLLLRTPPRAVALTRVNGQEVRLYRPILRTVHCY
jgi:hypothetical protein